MSDYWVHVAAETLAERKLTLTLTPEDEAATRQALSRTRAALFEHEKRQDAAEVPGLAFTSEYDL